MTTAQKATQFGVLQIAIILLTVATAVIHLYLGLSFGMTMFILNGIGYFGLLIDLIRQPHDGLKQREKNQQKRGRPERRQQVPPPS